MMKRDQRESKDENEIIMKREKINWYLIATRIESDGIILV